MELILFKPSQIFVSIFPILNTKLHTFFSGNLLGNY